MQSCVCVQVKVKAGRLVTEKQVKKANIWGKDTNPMQGYMCVHVQVKVKAGH